MSVGIARRLGSLFHHAGLAAIILQLCILYGASALYKVQGEMWQNGTAIYYITRTQEFAWPGVSSSLSPARSW